MDEFPKEMLRSTLKRKLDPFKNLVNLSDKTFIRSEFKQLTVTLLFTLQTIQQTNFK